MKFWSVIVVLGILAASLSSGFNYIDEEDICREKGLVMACDVTCECVVPEVQHERP